jgi:hypothetical protein
MSDTIAIDNVSFVGRTLSRNLVVQCHYSKVMPRITKAFIGGWKDNKLVATMTLGYGTRPRHTIEGMFPSLGVNDYFEIGKLCVSDEMPRNTESNFISRAITLLKKEYPDVKILFSWADGILGRPGFVYQASNFYYGGFIVTEIYINQDGIKIHPRTVQGLTARNGEKRGPRDYETTNAIGLTKYWGKQFRYVYPLCGKREWNRLCDESPMQWKRGCYPKDVDCTWEKQVRIGERVSCGMPPFIAGEYVKKQNTQQLMLDMGIPNNIRTQLSSPLLSDFQK